MNLSTKIEKKQVKLNLELKKNYNVTDRILIETALRAEASENISTRIPTSSLALEVQTQQTALG